MKYFRQTFFRAMAQYNILRQNNGNELSSEVKGSLEQHTDISPHLSDHKMFINNGVLNWNMMMQARERASGGYNNGFRKSETKFEYQARLRTTAQFIAYHIANNPSISYISLQEAPVDEADLQVFKKALEAYLPPEWMGQYSSLYVDHTSWGIFTLFNKDKIKCDEITREEILKEAAITDIDIRCRTYSLSQKEQLQNHLVTILHLPHGNPEEAFRHVFKKILNQTKKPLYKKHDILGDYNINPSRLKEIIDEELKAFQEEETQAFDINVDICPSIEGHLDANGQHLTVDHQLTLHMTPSKNPHSSVNYTPRSARNFLGLYMVIALTTSGMMFTDVLDEEDELPSAHFGANF